MGSLAVDRTPPLDMAGARESEGRIVCPVVEGETEGLDVIEFVLLSKRVVVQHAFAADPTVETEDSVVGQGRGVHGRLESNDG